MIDIEMITKIGDVKNIAIMDTSSISFLQRLDSRGISVSGVLCDYELILIPQWVLIEIEDASGRAEYIQKLIDEGYPIRCIAEETYSALVDWEEANLYQIVLASVSLLGRMRAYLRRYVEKEDLLDIDEYCKWINQLYEEWPIPGGRLSNGRQRKKNAGEVSITVLTEVLSWYYPETEMLTIYSQDRDTYEYQRKAEEQLRSLFVSRNPVPVSYKSNDSILCQLYREGEIRIEDICILRKNKRRITFSKERKDCSVLLSTEMIDDDAFIELIRDPSVHIIF